MGCIFSSSLTSSLIVENVTPQPELSYKNSKSRGNLSKATSRTLSKKTSSATIEEKIELIFKSKRENIYAPGVTLNNRIHYRAKHFKKTATESNFIRAALDQSFVFASLDDGEKQTLSNAMEQLTVMEGEDVITQANLEEGRSFGELALLYNTPRAATIRALQPCVVYALDRDTFQNTLANSSHSKSAVISAALSVVPLLQGLNDWQLEKISGSVEIIHFLAGDFVIEKGTAGNVFYMIKEGTVRVMDIGEGKTDHNLGPGECFNEAALLCVDHNLGPGEYFGERALLKGEPRAANIAAVSDVILMALDRESFNSLLGPIKEVLEENLVLRERNPLLRPVSMIINLQNFKISDLDVVVILGSGTFGRVSLVQERKSKSMFALKAMLKSDLVLHRQENNVLSEKNIMMNCNHPFILKLYQTFRDERKLYMLLEFVQGGELFAVIHVEKKQGLSNQSGAFYATGMIMALKYLHQKDIAYRDLKPENCLIDCDGYPKLIDFGFAKIIPQGQKSYTLCGTPEYLAPELVLGRRGHNKAVDYWAFGVLIYEMQTGDSPFCDHESFDQVVICRNIVNGNLHFPRNYNVECKDLTCRLLVREIQKRLGRQRGGVDDIIRHPWFADMDFPAYYKKQVVPPWIPEIKGIMDSSHFDARGIGDHGDDGSIDSGTWDQNY